MVAERNIVLLAALRDEGAFADDPGTVGVTAPFAATRAELFPSHLLGIFGGVRVYARVCQRWLGLLDPLNLEAARATGRPLEDIAADLWMQLSDAVAEHRGRVLVTWASLSQSMRDMLTVVLIGAPHSWVI